MHKKDLLENPLEEFTKWYQAAKQKGEDDVDAMALATAMNNKPSIRVVLYKGLTENGILFYTNYDSRKAHELEQNPQAAVVFYWPKSYRQIRIEGHVEKVSAAVSDKYFATRARASQLGAWASPQSHVIENREILDERYDIQAAKFHDQAIPRPEFWGGFCLIANVIEFWQGQPHRLHDRIRYTRNNNAWTLERLAP